MSTTSVALDKLAVRETIEDYLSFLDAKDWEGIASCFSDDAQSWYNLESQALEGGRGVADWIRARISQYGPTDHALSNLHIAIEGDLATCDSRLTASLHHPGNDGNAHVAVRAIRYRDKLRRSADRWLIYERHHEPQWQYVVASQALHL